MDFDVRRRRGCIRHHGWRRGVVATALVVSTKLLYVEPG